MTATPPPPNPLLEAALAYARRGWPVFPCRESDSGQRKAKQPYTRNGLKDGCTDPEQIRAWWRKWPQAMIGLPMGVNGLFALDFDPRIDEESGEVFTLDRLKAETEDQIRGSLPTSATVITPSDGVHLYLLQPDGEPVRNRGNLPDHVDVRGAGGYVIAPPSIIYGADGMTRRYRWLRSPETATIAKPPEQLVKVLRDRGSRSAGKSPSPRPSPVEGRGGSAEGVDEAVRKYALAALDGELEAVRRAPDGQRNNQLNISALKIASLVASGALNGSLARSLLEQAARENSDDDERQLQATIDSGWSAGMNNPRDLGEVAAAARSRRERSEGRRSQGSASRAPPRDRARPAPRQGQPDDQSFRSGREDGAPDLAEGERARLKRVAEAWLGRRLEHVKAEAKELTAIAWGAGRRVAAGLLDAGEVKEKIWPHCEDVADIQHADIDKAIEDGIARGFDPGPLLLDFKCAMYPMTDFGIGERFRDRYGKEFRFTTGKGWLGWDGRRWKVLDQDKDTPPAELIAAVMETIRGIQREAKRIAETGIRLRLISKGKDQYLDEDDPTEHALDCWILVGRQWKLLSSMIAAFGRQAETAGKPLSIGNLAKRWLTVPIEEFDCEQLSINVLNGTLRFDVEEQPDGRKKASVRLDPHRREDLITRVAPIDYDPTAACPLYDGMIAWAQPDAPMRRYLHQVGGYACTGDTGEHKLWFHWGGGRNGKSTTIDAWCSALGDYSGTIGIESFLDQGIKKRGDQATPDLAKLGGIRLLRASEPGRDAKLDSALIKAVTGGEPMSVRALHRGFFDLMPRFKLNVSGNVRPSIPDTDDGIWSRLKLVPWSRNIEKPIPGVEPWPEKDPKLLDKIKFGELPGVFNRLLAGLCDYLQNGFAEPEKVTAATQAYRDNSDPLARFLRLCTERDPDSRVQSSVLHKVFVAWAKAAGEQGKSEWSNKGFTNAMLEKGYEKKASDGMQWLGIRLIRQAEDFVDEHGNAKAMPDDLALEPPRVTSPPDERPPPLPGDDFIPGFDD